MLLNLDGGEHEDEPEELWRLADIICIACGGHAGDDASMKRVAAVARAIGAHPSYPDRAGFGRATLAIDTAPIPASRFAVPAGYKPVDLMGSPGRQGSD